MPETVLSFNIPGAPKGKARPRVTRSGHAFTPAGTAQYENLVRLSFKEAYPDHMPLGSAVEASITAFFPIPKSWSKKKQEQARQRILRPVCKPDTDNIAKAVLDSLNQIAYKDDSQITELIVSKYYSDIPQVVVMLRTDQEE